MNESDPTSIYYKRQYNKSKINLIKLLKILGIYLTCIIILWCLFHKKIFIIIFSIIFVLINLKNIVILLVKIYQHMAPISLRSKCRFEPSCSNYMLLSIEKYGFFTGIKKGINRLKRCNINNGGYDYP